MVQYGKFHSPPEQWNEYDARWPLLKSRTQVSVGKAMNLPLGFPLGDASLLPGASQADLVTCS